MSRVRQTPYQRGCFYFVELGREIRDRSHGRRRLEDVLYPLFVARAKGSPITQVIWEAMLHRELGEQAVADFRAVNVNATATVVPTMDTFGPCFNRQSVPLAAADGARIAAYQWTRTAGVAEAACRNF